MHFEKIDAVATAELIRSGAMPPDFAVEAALERISRRDPLINAVIDRFDDHAREQISAEFPMGLLAGVPFLIKDSIEYPGFRHTDGSRWFSDRIGKKLPSWIAAMRAQGAIFIGRTNSPEFGLMDTTEPVAYGPTLNPWNPALSAGGSSGGSAAAVAAGIVPIAHGTDGGGSIRYPAACCGVFGFKPSNDLEIDLIPPFDPRLPGGAVRHVITRSVRDSALTFAIASASIAGNSSNQSIDWVRGPNSRRLRIAVIKTPTHGGRLAAIHDAAVDHAQSLLESLGHVVDRTVWPFDGPKQHTSFFKRWSYVAYRFSMALPEQQRSEFLNSIEPFTLGLIKQGSQFPSETVESLVQDACSLKLAMDDFYKNYDVLLTPISAASPHPIGHHDPRLEFDVVMGRVAENVAFTYVQNVAGQPAMSVPLFWTEEMLPIGVQLASGTGSDKLLLSLAYELEQAQPWQHRWPQLVEQSA